MVAVEPPPNPTGSRFVKYSIAAPTVARAAPRASQFFEEPVAAPPCRSSFATTSTVLAVLVVAACGLWALKVGGISNAARSGVTGG